MTDKAVVVWRRMSFSGQAEAAGYNGPEES